MEIYTNVEIDGKVYSIKKFTAKEGLVIARLIMAKVLAVIPMIDTTPKKPADDSSQADAKVNVSASDDSIYDVLAKVLEDLSEDDLNSLIDKCLRVCYLVLPAGNAPIIDATGNYGVPDIEYDLPLTIRLCIEAIKWGASDFFGEKQSLSPLRSLLAGSRQNR